MVLGHFSFGRLAMYADLSPENWKEPPIEHRPLKVILQGSEAVGDAELPVAPHDYDVDTPEIEKLAPVLIQDADASQHSALVDVKRRALIEEQELEVVAPGSEVLETDVGKIDASLEAINWVQHLSFLGKDSQVRKLLLSENCLAARMRIVRFPSPTTRSAPPPKGARSLRSRPGKSCSDASVEASGNMIPREEVTVRPSLRPC